MIKLYNHNIWGGFNKNEAIANRADLLLGIIADEDPDVITFQECEPDTFRAEVPSIIERFSHKYTEAAGEFANKNFTPVFYRHERFTLVDSGFHVYSGLNDIESKSVTWAVLKDKNDGKVTAFASTHFWFRARDKQDEEQRRENAREAAGICRGIAEKYGCPEILAGDLNSCDLNGQGLGGYLQMLDEGFADVRHTAKITTDSHTEHYYPPRDENGNYIPGEKPNHTLDYIFTMGEVKAESFAVITTDAALAASDHCPLTAVFEI